MNNSASIFIADDNEVNRLLLQSQLETRCSNITLAANGKTALAYLLQFKYDLILLDLRMPYYSGLDLIKIIKQQDSLNLNSPVVAITAHAQNYQRKTLIEAGFDECLIKPVFLNQLEEIVNLWLPASSSNSNSIHLEDNGTINYALTLLQRTSGNTSLTIDIFNKLFIELPKQLLLIEQALTSNNVAEAKEITHKINGSVSFCGFTDIQVLASNLETSLSEDNAKLMHSNFNLLKAKITGFIELKYTLLDQL